MPTSVHSSRDVRSVACAVVTVSDTRTKETDASGRLIVERLVGAGHRVVGYEVFPDDPGRIRMHVEALCTTDCQAVLITGGTGPASRDTTYEAVSGLLEKRLDGFGELFRMLSFAEIGAAAILSRAVAGVRGQTTIFSMPGSTGAVRLAMDKLILPQLGHIVSLVGF